MKNNKKILTEVSRLQELMGVKKELLNENPKLILVAIKKLRAALKNVNIPPRKVNALTDRLDKIVSPTSTVKQKVAAIYFLAKNGTDEMKAIIKLMIEGSQAKTIKQIDDVLGSEEIKSRIKSFIENGLSKEDVVKIFTKDASIETGDDLFNALMTKRMKTQVAGVYDEISQEITPKVRPDGDEVKPDGDKVKPDGDKVKPDGDEVKPDGDKVKPDGVGGDRATITKMTDAIKKWWYKDETMSVDELLKISMGDIPKLSDKSIDLITNSSLWKRFQPSWINNMFKSQKSIIEQSQKILKTLSENPKNLSAVAKRKLEERLFSNMNDLITLKGNNSYIDFYRWMDDLATGSKDRELIKWWNALRKKPALTILQEISNAAMKRPSLLKRLGSAFVEGWSSQKKATADLRVRVFQKINPFRQGGLIINKIKKILGKDPLFKIAKATDEQKSAFKRYFWTGNQTGYKGFREYMDKNNLLSAIVRSSGQFSRGFLIGSAFFTVAETVYKFGPNEGEGYESYTDMFYQLFTNYWDNILGLKYAIPSYTLLKPLAPLVNGLANGMMFKEYDTLDELTTWLESQGIEEYFENWFSGVDAPLTGDTSTVVPLVPEVTPEVTPDDSTPPSPKEPGSLEHINNVFGGGVTQEGEFFIWDGDKYKWNGTDYEWVQ